MDMLWWNDYKNIGFTIITNQLSVKSPREKCIAKLTDFEMNVRPLTPTLADIALRDLNETPERIQQDLHILREWIKKQRHLRARTSDQFLVAFLRRCHFSLEKTKKRIDNFFSYYNVFPEVFRNRSITSRIFDINRLGVHYYPEFPRCTDKSAILIARFGQFDPNRYNVREIFQFIMMAMEIISVENDYATVAGVSQILDLANITFENIKRFDRSIFERYWTWLEDCCPLRIKEVYVINAAKDIQFRIHMIKTLMKNQLAHPIRTVKSMEELYTHIPRSNLPEEYGGSNGHIGECVAYMEDLLHTYRQYFDEDTLYGCSEELRSGDIVSYEAEFGLNGSFRMLNFD
ncbi:alpha-tocopherol transfer protein-like [Stomoxys calcitrans]|uniref:CRAL-TRIO domain-containing protein n=1 Tax=Stomoxys calcitrans TaxID=35570 RepID=A0A1I8P379_STOCA|nr:alpha-tocopherol transfer protein-like [Stomoxys calcitrans]